MKNFELNAKQLLSWAYLWRDHVFNLYPVCFGKGFLLTGCG